MAVWEWLADAAGVVLLAILCYGALLVVRRRLISRHGGTFELSLRDRGRKEDRRSGRGWVLGIGRYEHGELQWFRLFSPLPRPRDRWAREELRLVGQREPAGPETLALFTGHVVVTCETGDGAVEMAMSRSALTGFQSWLESGPPGADWGQRSRAR